MLLVGLWQNSGNILDHGRSVDSINSATGASTSSLRTAVMGRENKYSQ